MTGLARLQGQSGNFQPATHCNRRFDRYISANLAPGRGLLKPDPSLRNARISEEISTMWISPAYAQAAEAAAPNPLMQMIPFVFIFVIFYFFLIRPQMTARKKHMEMVSNVRRGDVVVTAGGIVGKVTKVLEGDEVMVELADKVAVKVVKSTLSDVRTKPEPAAND